MEALVGWSLTIELLMVLESCTKKCSSSSAVGLSISWILTHSSLLSLLGEKLTALLSLKKSLPTVCAIIEQDAF